MKANITDYIKNMADISCDRNNITPDMYNNHTVYRGLRDLNGKGVVTGLTEISYIKAKDKDSEGNEIPCRGKLYYRGIDVEDIVKGFTNENRYGFEETVYLLLFSELPNREQLEEFTEVLSDMRELPPVFARDMILRSSGKDMMNMLSRGVLALYAYDDNPDEITVANVLRQSMYLISVLPMLAVYSYQGYQHYHKEDTLFLNHPQNGASTAEVILSLLRPDSSYTELEAKTLDMALVLHAEHGGGNNSTFTTHVVTSSGTDTYSAISAALGSLKGPRHGGANVKVVKMFEDMKNNIDTQDEKQIENYLEKLLDGEAFDKAGLIYGMGHAVYSLSDPRAELLKKCAGMLAKEKDCEQEYKLYDTVATLAPQIIAGKRKMYKGVSANVDFYSGLIYSMLGIPCELYTTLFAMARIAGWSAHRIEEIQNEGKIIRPAYINVKKERPYVDMDNR